MGGKPAANASPANGVFDCSNGVQTLWPVTQQEWCCAHKHVGCYTPPGPPVADASSTMHFDCNAGFNNWKHGWSLPKQRYCCRTFSKACPANAAVLDASTTVFEFDCQAGFQNWKTGWSLVKKDWCCRNQQRGCLDSQSVTTA